MSRDRSPQLLVTPPGEDDRGKLPDAAVTPTRPSSKSFSSSLSSSSSSSSSSSPSSPHCATLHFPSPLSSPLSASLFSLSSPSSPASPSPPSYSTLSSSSPSSPSSRRASRRAPSLLLQSPSRSPTLDRLRQPLSPALLPPSKRCTIDAIPLPCAPVLDARLSLSLSLPAAPLLPLRPAPPALVAELWAQAADDPVGLRCVARSAPVPLAIPAGDADDPTASCTFDDDDQLSLSRIYAIESLRLHILFIPFHHHHHHHNELLQQEQQQEQQQIQQQQQQQQQQQKDQYQLKHAVLAAVLPVDFEALKTKQIMNLNGVNLSIPIPDPNAAPTQSTPETGHTDAAAKDVNVACQVLLGYFHQPLPKLIADGGRLAIITRISSGMYGKVWRGVLDKRVPVAIKAAVPVSNDELAAKIAQMVEEGEIDEDDVDDAARPLLKSMLEEERVHQLLNEVDALARLGPHPYVVSYLGAQISKKKLYVLSELLDGDLRSFLRKCNDPSILSISSSSNLESSPLIISSTSTSTSNSESSTSNSESSSTLTISNSISNSTSLSPTSPRMASAASPRLHAVLSHFAGRVEARVAWCAQLMEAVSFLHRHGWVHADIKPENVLYSAKSATIRLADFGFARQVRTQEEARRFGAQCKGSGLYMGPEVYHGSYNGPESDVYSAAITMWEILTMKDAFADIAHFNASVMERITDQHVELSQCLRPSLDDVPQSLRDALFQIPPLPPGSTAQSVWHPNYLHRPTANQVYNILLNH